MRSRVNNVERLRLSLVSFSSILKVIAVQFLDLVGIDLGHTDAEIHHQLRKLFAIDQNELALSALGVFE